MGRVVPSCGTLSTTLVCMAPMAQGASGAWHVTDSCRVRPVCAVPARAFSVACEQGHSRERALSNATGETPCQRSCVVCALGCWSQSGSPGRCQPGRRPAIDRQSAVGSAALCEQVAGSRQQTVGCATRARASAGRAGQNVQQDWLEARLLRAEPVRNWLLSGRCQDKKLVNHVSTAELPQVGLQSPWSSPAPSFELFTRKFQAQASLQVRRPRQVRTLASSINMHERLPDHVLQGRSAPLRSSAQLQVVAHHPKRRRVGGWGQEASGSTDDVAERSSTSGLRPVQREA